MFPSQPPFIPASQTRSTRLLVRLHRQNKNQHTFSHLLTFNPSCSCRLPVHKSRKTYVPRPFITRLSGDGSSALSRPGLNSGQWEPCILLWGLAKLSVLLREVRRCASKCVGVRWCVMECDGVC